MPELERGPLALNPAAKDIIESPWNRIQGALPKLTAFNTDLYALWEFYKWFTKVLTMRLTVVADSVISKTHTSFLSRRNILEGVVILHETLHKMRRKKKKGITMKLDFENAYDKVAWSFLMEVLEKEISSQMDRVGINLNGEPKIFFRTFKGLR
jgi:hypothetical protein